MIKNDLVLGMVIKSINDITNPEDVEDTEEGRMKQLTDMLFELIKLSEPHDQVKEKLSAAKKEVEEELLNLMIVNDFKSFEDTKGRGKISWDAPVRAEVRDKIEFFLYLRGTGDEAVAQLKIGPDLIDDEMVEKIKNSKPGDVEIGMQWNSLLAYAKSKLDEAEDKREKDEDEDPRTKDEIYLDEDLWLPGLRMNKNEPKLKVKQKKGT
ncbi:MAG: hypothetical protein KAJ19_00530 [Gammaproteobacteria bacterium]|nr:hypothetical protein [Gammaproteobacteria bacterium]